MISVFSKPGTGRPLRIRKLLIFRVTLVLLLSALCLFYSCARRLGYGVLLWAVEDPPVPSGTVLPVYIRSNIDQVWVAGIPDEYRAKESKVDKFEIPLSKLELVGSRKEAALRAEELAPFALSYAETLQDGLPIRETPDNNAQRVYRLKQGEIIKILSPARGAAAVGASGDPLPGEWFNVLAGDGTKGYCFSYRLKLFEYKGGALAAAPAVSRETAEDPELDRILSRKWSAETYGGMVNSGRFDLEELSMQWGFDPGQDTGIARINTKEVEKSFSYTAIVPTGTRSWRFEGAPLQMDLRSDTTLAVQFTENGGMLRTILFVVLPSTAEDLIIQETARRDELFNIIFRQGPEFTSHNYGTISFSEGGRFNWTGFELLVPQIIPETALGSGNVNMRLFLAPQMSGRYTGAFTMRFSRVNNSAAGVDFLYSIDNQGFMLEYVPDTSRDGLVVTRRSSTPLVMYFSRAEPKPQYTAPSSFNAPAPYTSPAPSSVPAVPFQNGSVPVPESGAALPGFDTGYGAEEEPDGPEQNNADAFPDVYGDVSAEGPSGGLPVQSESPVPPAPAPDASSEPSAAENSGVTGNETGIQPGIPAGTSGETFSAGDNF